MFPGMGHPPPLWATCRPDTLCNDPTHFVAGKSGYMFSKIVLYRKHNQKQNKQCIAWVNRNAPFPWKAPGTKVARSLFFQGIFLIHMESTYVATLISRALSRNSNPRSHKADYNCHHTLWMERKKKTPHRHYLPQISQRGQDLVPAGI